MGWFGTSIKRKEDPDLLTGRGRYVDDIKLPGMLHAVVLRSPHAHAGIRGIDKRPALALPGVHAVFTFADLPASMQRQTVPLLVPSPAIKQACMPYCLAKNEACFVGEPVAIVVADSRYLAEDAAALVAIDFEPLPAVSDCVAALAARLRISPPSFRSMSATPRRPSRRRRMSSASNCSSIAADPSFWSAAA
jgi:carbon-monoxide dehydrogenase large subunit